MILQKNKNLIKPNKNKYQKVEINHQDHLKTIYKNFYKEIVKMLKVN